MCPIGLTGSGKIATPVESYNYAESFAEIKNGSLYTLPFDFCSFFPDGKRVAGKGVEPQSAAADMNPAINELSF